ncbi:hypothetical protein HK101_004620 [Irineochytrium annulatum]|nr:hypothetical protein HK101_004620 [Irineochytrium annulatum]
MTYNSTTRLWLPWKKLGRHARKGSASSTSTVDGGIVLNDVSSSARHHPSTSSGNVATANNARPSTPTFLASTTKAADHDPASQPQDLTSIITTDFPSSTASSFTTTPIRHRGNLRGAPATPSQRGPADTPAPAKPLTWWYENRERVADRTLTRILGVAALVWGLYCAALLFVPGVGVVGGVATMKDLFGVIDNNGTDHRSPAFLRQCQGWPFYPIMFFEAVFALVISPAIIYALYRTRDSHGIRAEILLNLVFMVPAIIIYIFMTLRNKKIQFMDPVLLMNVSMLLSVIPSLLIPIVSSYREERRRKGVRLALNMSSFRSILDDPMMLAEFRAFCVRELTVENAIFWQECVTLKRFASQPAPHLWSSSAPDGDSSNAPQHIPTTPSTSTPKHFLQRLLLRRDLDAPAPSPPIAERAATPTSPRASTDTFCQDDPSTPQDSNLPHHASLPRDRPSDISDAPTTVTSPNRRSSADPDATLARATTSARVQRGAESRPVPPGLAPLYRSLYECFVDERSAPMEVNLPSRVRMELAKRFAAAGPQGEGLTVDVFDEAVGCVEENMFFESYPKFRAAMVEAGRIAA